MSQRLMLTQLTSGLPKKLLSLFITFSFIVTGLISTPAQADKVKDYLPYAAIPIGIGIAASVYNKYQQNQKEEDALRQAEQDRIKADEQQQAAEAEQQRQQAEADRQFRSLPKDQQVAIILQKQRAAQSKAKQAGVFGETIIPALGNILN